MPSPSPYYVERQPSCSEVSLMWMRMIVRKIPCPQYQSLILEETQDPSEVSRKTSKFVVEYCSVPRLP